MTTTWHADTALLTRYANGDLDEARAYSLEAHLLACDTCRAGVAGVSDHAQLDRMWAEVTEAVDAPKTGVVERGLVRLGVSDHVARLLAATPSLRLSWLGAEALALGFAVVAANSAITERGRSLGTFLFLVVAALLPVGGVAAAYGPGLDPTYEVSLASPMRSFGLLMTRAAAVLGTSTVLAGIAALSLPGMGWTTVAWLLPSLGLTLASLALATRLRPLVAAGSVTFAWAAVSMIATHASHDRFEIFRGGGQAAFLVIIALSTIVIARRREAFEQGVRE
jgi:anti-sigma factor RsiW